MTGSRLALVILRDERKLGDVPRLLIGGDRDLDESELLDEDLDEKELDDDDRDLEYRFR